MTAPIDDMEWAEVEVFRTRPVDAGRRMEWAVCMIDRTGADCIVSDHLTYEGALLEALASDLPLRPARTG